MMAMHDLREVCRNFVLASCCFFGCGDRSIEPESDGVGDPCQSDADCADADGDLLCEQDGQCARPSASEDGDEGNGTATAGEPPCEANACPDTGAWDAENPCRLCAGNETSCYSFCVDVSLDENHCGQCGRECAVVEVEGGEVGICQSGLCAATLSDCVPTSSTCDTVCASAGESCVENGCLGSTAVLYDNALECDSVSSAVAWAEGCTESLPSTSDTARCCCTQTL
jgi:hypothetical protein